MRHYATLFDSKFLPQGLALYESLKRHSSQPFTLHVLAMDDDCLVELDNLDLEGLHLTRLRAFELNKAISVAKASRTWQEFCWTCASNYAHAQVVSAGLTEITYLDADCFFFSDPEQLFAEIGERAIGIIPHRFPPHRKHMEVNGRFNVSWVTFKRPIGLQCLQRWAEQCREKCSAKEGCGDQCYLDAWPSAYGSGEVCEIQNIGVGAAPWNLSQYKVTERNGSVYLDEAPLVFYHYHELVPGKRLTNYPLRKSDVELIYQPYLSALQATKTAA